MTGRASTPLIAGHACSNTEADTTFRVPRPARMSDGAPGQRWLHEQAPRATVRSAGRALGQTTSIETKGLLAQRPRDRIRFNTLSPSPINTPTFDGQADLVRAANALEA